MKVKFFHLILVAAVLASCTQPATPTLKPAVQETAAVGAPEGFAEPDPESYVMLMPAVRAYFYYRKQAVTGGDVKLLWAQFPALANGADPSTGVNAEATLVDGMQGLKPFDGNIFPEYYQRMQVRRSGDQAEVLLHGMELYLWADESGRFDDSGGEFKVILFLRLEGGKWVVYQTDEVTLAEWQGFAP
jgi:hypothetical protein